MKNLKKIRMLFIILTFATSFAALPSSGFAGVGQTETKNKEGNFVAGAKLWASRCSSCHNLRDPKDLTDSEWGATMMHMRVRAGLTGQDARNILKFLQNSN